MIAGEKHNGRWVAYFRVSTERQGRSGLGLEAQREAVRQYLDGGRWRLVAEFVEVESGKRADNRPELAKALSACRAHRATLVVAKIDRLARNVAFTAALMESSVEFVACDFPQANKLTIHVLSAVAEHEREMISARTKAALAAARRRGVRLGTPANLTERDAARGRNMGRQALTVKARATAADLLPVVEQIRGEGIVSFSGIARVLTERGIPTARGFSTWRAGQVQKILALAERVEG